MYIYTYIIYIYMDIYIWWLAEGIYTHTHTHTHTHLVVGRGYVTSLKMAKGGKGKKEGKTKPTSNQAASPPTAPAAAKISPAPSPIPKIALVDDDGVPDAAVLARAKEVLAANRSSLGEVMYVLLYLYTYYICIYCV
jgi:hypothetical protein